MNWLDVKDFLIDEESTMISAMEQLDRVAKKVLFVIRGGQLVAAITDGDIRRWILKKGSLDALVKDIANYDAKYLTEQNKSLATEFMRKHSIIALPVVDEKKAIVSIVFWDDEEIEPKKNLTLPVVIMAGGLGTRLYPYTKILPKPLIPIGEIPIVEHIMNRFHQHGVSEFFLVVNHKRNMIKAYFSEVERPYAIRYVDEDQPLGTGGGLSLLKGMINSTFILSNCDILIEEDYEKIFEYHKKENNLITMVCSLKNIRIPYGVVEINDNGEIDEMREKPELSFFTNTGLYVVESQIIEQLGDNECISFPGIIERHKNAGGKIGIYPISENSWLDMGQLDEMEKMRRRLEHDG